MKQQANSPTIKRYTWAEIDSMCSELAAKILLSSFTPTVIITVLRGGAIPGVMLSYKLGVREIYALRMQTTVNDAIRAERVRPAVSGISAIPSLARRSVLLVDDVTNTGETIFAARDALRRRLCRSLLTVALVWDTVSPAGDDPIHRCAVDHYVDKIHAWAGFPWEPSGTGVTP